MSILLKLKHWQLFLITWGIPVLIEICTFNNISLLIKMFPVMIVFFILGSIGWVWAIGTRLQEFVPKHIDLKVNRFKMIFAVPIIYVAYIIFILFRMFDYSKDSWVINYTVSPLVLFSIHLIATVCIFYAFYFAAKTIKTIELEREVRFKEFSKEFILIWFSIIGIWILQPKLNKLIKKGS